MTKNVCMDCYKVDEKCDCKRDRQVEIDDNMVDIIIEMNRKGYITKHCCGGHLMYSDNDVYIVFKNYDKELNKPFGFKYRYKKGVHHVINCFSMSIDYENYVEELEKEVSSLRKWVNELPDWNVTYGDKANT